MTDYQRRIHSLSEDDSQAIRGGSLNVRGNHLGVKVGFTGCRRIIHRLPEKNSQAAGGRFTGYQRRIHRLSEVDSQATGKVFTNCRRVITGYQ